MVGETALWEVVGAYAVRPVTAANQAFALSRIFGGTFRAVFFLNTCGQYTQCLRFVAVLASSILALRHDAGGQMGDTYRRVGFVDVLPACTAGSESVNA